MMRAIATYLSMICASMCCSGCVGWFMQGSATGLGYVLIKGDSENIAKWTMKQTDGQKIWDGLRALDYRAGQAINDPKRLRERRHWLTVTMSRFEDWPPDDTIVDDSGESGPLSPILGSIFDSIASEAYNKPLVNYGYFYELRPSDAHAPWLPIWEKSRARLEMEMGKDEGRAALRNRLAASTRSS